MRERKTVEVPAITDADLMATMRGPVPAVLRSWGEECDMAETQELPCIPETRPARLWSEASLDRLLADVRRS